MWAECEDWLRGCVLPAGLSGTAPLQTLAKQLHRKSEESQCQLNRKLFNLTRVISATYGEMINLRIRYRLENHRRSKDQVQERCTKRTRGPRRPEKEMIRQVFPATEGLSQTASFGRRVSVPTLVSIDMGHLDERKAAAHFRPKLTSDPDSPSSNGDHSGPFFGPALYQMARIRVGEPMLYCRCFCSPPGSR